MAEDPGLTAAQYLIAPALDRFARAKGWDRRDYGIYYKTNPDVGRIHILFVAEGFDHQDDHAVTNEVWAFLETELHDEPEVLQATGLVVRSMEKVSEGGLYAIAPTYTKYRPMTYTLGQDRD